MRHHKRYPTVYKPNDPLAMSSGNLYLHRFLAERALGYALPPKVVVHHHTLSRTEELVICENQAYHLLLHRRLRAYQATGDPTYRKCVRCLQWDKPANLRIYPDKGRPEGESAHARCSNAASLNYRQTHAVTPRTRRKNLIHIVAAEMFCRRGHPYNDENTHIDKTGSRKCRACNRERMQVRRKLIVSKWDPRTRTEGPVR